MSIWVALLVPFSYYLYPFWSMEEGGKPSATLRFPVRQTVAAREGLIIPQCCSFCSSHRGLGQETGQCSRHLLSSQGWARLLLHWSRFLTTSCNLPTARLSPMPSLNMWKTQASTRETRLWCCPHRPSAKAPLKRSLFIDKSQLGKKQR